jgi:putative hydrolase of the HAD superfamily
MAESPGADAPAAGPLEAVLFDVGGPVYDDACYARALLRAARELAGAVAEDEFRAAYDAARQRQAGGLRAAIAARFGADRAALSALAERYWEYPPEALHPDVRPALEALAPRYRLGVVANQRAHVTHALRRDGLIDFFDVLALSEEVGAEKPDPRIFRHALDELGVAPRRAVHVGNRLDTDVRPARRLGIRTVWVLRGEAPPAPTPDQLEEPDASIRSLRELPEVLVRIEAVGAAEGARRAG